MNQEFSVRIFSPDMVYPSPSRAKSGKKSTNLNKASTNDILTPCWPERRGEQSFKWDKSGNFSWEIKSCLRQIVFVVDITHALIG